MREFLPRRIRIRFQIAGGGHHEAGHAERALESLLVDHALLHGGQLAGGGIGEAFDRDDLLAARALREERARVVRHVVDEHGAGAALGAVAADLRAGEAELVAQRHRQRFLRHHVDAALLAVDVERDQPLDRTGRRRLAVQGRRAEQVGGRRGHRARGDDTFNKGTSGNSLRCVFGHRSNPRRRRTWATLRCLTRLTPRTGRMEEV